MLESILTQIGLTKNETKVYLALLKTGESKTGEILKNANLNSGKIYEILNSLQKKGLVSCLIKSNVKHFFPANPKQILNYLDEKKDKIDKQKEEYEKILPSLLADISSKKAETKVEVFIGINGLKTAYQKEVDKYDKVKKVYSMGLTRFDNYSKAANNYFFNYIYPKRMELGVTAKKLIHSDIKKKQKNENIRYLPFSTMVTTNIIDDLTILSIHTKTIVVITIESKEVADNYIENFNMLWEVGLE